jgi:hypothetical protein
MHIRHILITKSSPLKLLNQIKPNLAGMVLGWVPFKIVSDSPALHSRWLLLLKIEISSIVHFCFSISQNELKGVGMIRVDFGPISETVYIDIILNTIIER